MGWKGHEVSIPVGMFFRKMHCHKCGCRLEKKKIGVVYQKGEPSYSKRIMGHLTIGMNRIEKKSYVYQCPNCKTEISYEEQRRISKQKCSRII